VGEGGGSTDVTTVVEKTVVVVGTADGLLVIADVKDGVDEVETGEDGRGELVEWAEDTAAGDENVCVVEVVGNGRMDVGVEIKVSPDMDSELVER
jgi:hypothetical protein